MKKYIKGVLKEIFAISHIVFIAYRGIPKTYNPPWTNHDFWELCYVDRGDRHIIIEHTEYHLKTGQGVFYAPNQNHITKGCDGKSSNTVHISFVCPRLDVNFFGNKVFTFNSHEKRLISDIITMGIKYYERVDNHSKLKGMRPKVGLPKHIPHFIKASLEYLLLSLYNKQNLSQLANNAVGSHRQNHLSTLVQSTIEFMHSNASKRLTIEEIVGEFNISGSYLRSLFKKETGKSIIDYFNDIKIDKAKVLIFEDAYTITEISEMLGFCTPGYFCKVFKKKANMTPTEFSKLVNPGLSFMPKQV